MHNCGEYISRCIGSLLDQGLKEIDYEIIVVNDGSTDNGHDIVTQYVQSHSNIRLIDQDNQGVGAARNTGKRIAKGEYIQFVDADDRLAIGWSKHMVKIIKSSNPDIISFDHMHVCDTRQVILDNAPRIIFDGSLKDYIVKHGIQPTCWSYVFRREITDAIDFGDFPIGEDLDFMVRAISNSQDSHIVATNAKAYCYYMRPTSKMHETNKKLIGTVIHNYIRFYDNIAKGGILNRLPKQCVEKFLMNHIQGVILTKMFSAGFSSKDLKKISAKCHESGVFPLPYIPNRTVGLLYWLARHPFAGWIFSFPFRHIYLKHIK